MMTIGTRKSTTSVHAFDMLQDNTKVIKHVTILGVVGVTTLVSIQSFAGECVQYGNRNQNAIDVSTYTLS